MSHVQCLIDHFRAPRLAWIGRLMIAENPDPLALAAVIAAAVQRRDYQFKLP